MLLVEQAVVTVPDRRLFCVAGMAAWAASSRARAQSSANTPPLFTQHDVAVDLGPLLAFIVANNGSVVHLDVRLPHASQHSGVRHVLLRDGQILVVIDERRWWARGIMLWIGEPDARGEGFASIKGSFAISTNRAFKGPGFNTVEGLPRLFTGYHVDPFA